MDYVMDESSPVSGKKPAVLCGIWIYGLHNQQEQPGFEKKPAVLCGIWIYGLPKPARAARLVEKNGT